MEMQVNDQAAIAVEETSGTTHPVFLEWQRRQPSDCSESSIGRMHYCQHCASPLALIRLINSPDNTSLEESVRQEPAAFTQRVGIELGIPVFKIAYTGEPLSAAAVMRVGKPEVRVLSADELANFTTVPSAASTETGGTANVPRPPEAAFPERR